MLGGDRRVVEWSDPTSVISVLLYVGPFDDSHVHKQAFFRQTLVILETSLSTLSTSIQARKRQRK